MDEFDDDDTHDKLMTAVIEYAKATEDWDKRHSLRTYESTSKLIRKIRKLAEQRQKELRQERNIEFEKKQIKKNYKKLDIYKNNHLNFKKGNNKKS